MRIDISDEVRAKVPTALLAVLDELDEAYGQPVRFFVVPALPVKAGGRADPQGFVEVPPQSRLSLNVIGEEIMHLQRWTRRYPAIEPTTVAQADGYGDDLAALGGHFDEYAFFPFLEGAGLDPRSELQPVIAEAVKKLQGGLLSRIPRIHGSQDFTLEWQVKLSRTYVVSELLSGPSRERDLLLQLFEGDLLRPCADLGRRIASEIVNTRDATPDQVAARMHRCLFAHLGLPQEAATIRGVF